ncbi:Transcriptional regulatory protein BaeR [Paenibacillus solanacearum]|uniref:Transcriptional regulatory protein BaeR n=1 Tax=Paenibacillus solanacearum TaxID=2048548 RepID=A0A916K1L6_9BACL|nr:response regulator transcription factor [Paenibacillus solanacearum]CAG7627593.1 Transcriptional regulatory protein BaeR [Paenibacillus solanacearum]
MQILLVEDEPKIREVLIAYLRNEGWNVDFTPNGLEAVEMFSNRPYDLVILDLMLEGMPGEEVCRTIRQTSTVPIVMLTSKSRESDTIEGLKLGADDYIFKPFRVKEVIARIHALLRRVKAFVPEKQKTSVLTFDKGRLVLDMEAKTLLVRGVHANLTSTEFKLLTVFVDKPGKIFSRLDLSHQVLGYRFHGDSRSIDTHVKNLRKKIEEDTKEPKYILTMVGEGYKFTAEADKKE